MRTKRITEIKLARLREQIQAGIDQLDRGEGIRIESRSGLDQLFAAIRDDDRV